MDAHLIIHGSKTAKQNMQIDEHLLENVTRPTLRLYQWQPAAVSIGRNQNEQDINQDFCKKRSIEIVRRVTGGTAIYHDKELTYSFIVPESYNLLQKDITESYKQIANALLHAFKKTNIHAKLQQIPVQTKDPNCFASKNWYEITVDEKKICGSAQRRKNEIVLQHGSILLDVDYDILASIFNHEKQKIEQSLTSLKHITKKEINIQELSKHIIEGFQKEFNLTFSPYNYHTRPSLQSGNL